MAEKPDYIVVGSGLAALSFSALAARQGRKVVMLETHEHAGGFGHTFSFGTAPRQYTFNAQLHYVWNCGPGQTVDSFLRKLGLRDTVTFEHYDVKGYDRMRMPGHSLDIPNDWQLLKQRLAELFPASADSCVGFLDDVKGLEEQLGEFAQAKGWPARLRQLPRLGLALRYRTATLQQAFDRHRLPLEAQTLLALQWPDFMLPPRDLSFIAYTMLFAGYMRGAYYPNRHFEYIIDQLVHLIRSHDGQVRLQHRVIEFLREGDRVVGVRAEEVDASGRPTGPTHELRGEQVICGMDPRQAATLIGPESFKRGVRKRLDYDYSVSNFMAYCAVEGIDLRDYGFGRSNLFHSEGVDLNATFDDMVIRGNYRQPSFAMTVPSLLTQDHSDCPPGSQIVELLTAADYRRFLHLKISDPRHYRAKKREVFDSMLDVIEREYVPKFREHICFKQLGSPTTNERYVHAPSGNSYGSNMTPANVGLARLNHETSIPGFHFCSASAGFAGFAGTIWTGCHLYEVLENDTVLSGPHTVAQQ